MVCPDLPQKTLLSPREVAMFLRISLPTVYRWYRIGILVGKKLNGSVRIYREPLLEQLKAKGKLEVEAVARPNS
jgi:excisionase family DNA binding protein